MKTGCCWILLTWTILLSALYLARAQVLPSAATFLNVGSDPTAVDCVMALPGDAERRPFVAAALVNVGLAKRVLIPKSAESPDVTDGIAPPSFELARRIYKSRGIAEDRIVILDGATQSTFDDLGLLARYLDVHPTGTAGIVTSAFHTRRTRWTVRRRLPQQAARITVISAPDPDFDAATWWRSNGGFRLITSEYLKLAFYWFAYGNGFYWIVSIAVVVAGLLAWRRRLKVARARGED